MSNGGTIHKRWKGKRLEGIRRGKLEAPPRHLQRGTKLDNGQNSGRRSNY